MITRTSILALDPGLVYPAVAVYVGDRLVRAERVDLPDHLTKMGVMDRCEIIACCVVDWLRDEALEWPATFVAEWPQIYPGGRGKGDPNQLVPLAAIATGVLVQLRRAPYSPPVDALSPKPAEVWKRLPKSTKGDPWISPRGRRLASLLRPEERAKVADYHDALDAAGLALWAAGRWKARKNHDGAV